MVLPFEILEDVRIEGTSLHHTAVTVVIQSSLENLRLLGNKPFYLSLVPLKLSGTTISSEA
jgi:hypothetical protein